MNAEQTVTSGGVSASQKDMANAIRALSMDAIEAAKSGHPGMPMGMADVATVLFTEHMKFDPKAPDWADRDRFVLSAGHGSMLLYSLLYLTGYEDVTLDELKRFRQLGSKTAGHPEYGHCAGVETTTGPLGQGISTAVGMALAERMLNARYGDALVDHYTYVIAGDGCLMEGISHEAIDMAGHLKLNRLIVLWDDNSITIDGPTSVATSTDQLKRFEAAGWNAMRVDGHNPAEVSAAIAKAKTSDRPTMIACKTIIGFGAPNKQNTEGVHGAPLGAAEIEAARAQLGWPHAPFEIPNDVMASWRAAGAKGTASRTAWQTRLDDQDAAQRSAFEHAISDSLSAVTTEAFEALKAKWCEEKPKLATRKASQDVINAVVPVSSKLVGGSADLTHSNLTHAKGQQAIKPGDYSGSYIHYGVREHGMASAMNGIALHGGFVPFGGTFLVFTDYCRPSIRLSALMRQRVVYVMTHDSIGLGEDGPTHQPVEHYAALRAIPDVLVFRPADAVETLEAWQMALEEHDRPSVLCLTRQGLPAFRTEYNDINLTGFGAYVVREPEGGRDVTLMASGSEVSLALTAADSLAAEGVKAAVVSMPCWELFREKPEHYRAEVLGDAPRVAIEAGIRQGWDEWLGSGGEFVGMASFGASAPADQLFEHFGITAEKAVAAAKRVIKG
ncbi:MAG: transketolase [Alphaproteobacteria bacterium]